MIDVLAIVPFLIAFLSGVLFGLVWMFWDIKQKDDE